MADQPTTCAWCRRLIPEHVYPYTLRLELFPAIEPSLQVSEEALAEDFEAEMRRIIDLMEEMDDDQVHEQEERMFVSHSFTLCPVCRDRLAAELKRLRGSDA